MIALMAYAGASHAGQSNSLAVVLGALAVAVVVLVIVLLTGRRKP